MILLLSGPGIAILLGFGLNAAATSSMVAWALVAAFPAGAYLYRAARKFSYPECGRRLPYETNDNSFVFVCSTCDISWDVGYGVFQR